MDFHLHPPPSTGPSSLAEYLNDNGVSRAVLIGIDASASHLRDPQVGGKVWNRLTSSPRYNFDPTGYIDSILSVKTREALIRKATEVFPQFTVPNELVAEYCDENPETFTGLGSVDLAKEEDYVQEKLEEIESLGLSGVKVLPTAQFFDPSDDAEFELVCEFCEREDKILMCHTGCDPGVFEIPEVSQDARPSRLSGVPETYDLDLVLAHFGSYSSFHPGLWLNEALELMEGSHRVWADVSAVPYLVTNEGYSNRIRDAVGFERVLFGSDFPFVNELSISRLVHSILASTALSSAEKKMVLSENAASLLN